MPQMESCLYCDDSRFLGIEFFTMCITMALVYQSATDIVTNSTFFVIR